MKLRPLYLAALLAGFQATGFQAGARETTQPDLLQDCFIGMLQGYYEISPNPGVRGDGEMQYGGGTTNEFITVLFRETAVQIELIKSTPYQNLQSVKHPIPQMLKMNMRVSLPGMLEQPGHTSYEFDPESTLMTEAPGAYGRTQLALFRNHVLEAANCRDVIPSAPPTAIRILPVPPDAVAHLVY